MMDKDSYETYEYLPENENETDQFFVVQDDGTYLSFNRQVQYVAQVQDVKEVVNNVEPCAMYDVSSPPFLLDVDNTAELISNPDQLMLPDGENIIFANNFILPVPNSEQQLGQNDVNRYEEPELHVNEVDNPMQKTMDICTEITLSDEQYQMLERKGWILLETNEKVYVLNTLGLHDITSNDKLIQKLKFSEAVECIDEENVPSLSNQQDNLHLVIGEDGIKLTEEISEEHDSFLSNVQDESMEISNLATTNDSINETKLVVTQLPNTALNTSESVVNESGNGVNALNKHLKDPSTENVLTKLLDEFKPLKTSTLKVCTDILFKDVPDKIALGETKTGKILSAKITKLNNDLPRRMNTTAPRTYLKRAQRKKNECSDKNKQEKRLNNTGIDDKLFETLIAQATRNGVAVRCSPQDIASAHSTVSQLLKIPDFKSSVFDRNLIITKVVSIQDEKGAYSSGSQPSLVTGRVTLMDSGCYCFIHVPDMLDRLLNMTENDKPVQDKGDLLTAINSADNTVLHVHVNEMKRADNVLRVSITLNKRKLPTKLTFEENKRKLPGMVLACRVCAALFRTEDELKEHQQTQCLDVEGDLTIDIDKKVVGYTTVENGNYKTYFCNQCKAEFFKLYNCLKHMKTHYNSMDKINESKHSESVEMENEPVEGVHKCKMCPSTYHHQSTLAKHILSKHIKV